MDKATLLISSGVGLALWGGLTALSEGTVSIIAAFAGALAAWLVLIQLIYQKRREDAAVVKDAINRISMVARFAHDHLEGHGDARAAWNAGWEMYCLMTVEIHHRDEEVQMAVVAIWDKMEDVIRTGMGAEPGLSWEEITVRRRETTLELAAAYGALTPLECLRELGAVPGTLTLPEFALNAPGRPDRAPRVEPKLGRNEPSEAPEK